MTTYPIDVNTGWQDTGHLIPVGDGLIAQCEGAYYWSNPPGIPWIVNGSGREEWGSPDTGYPVSDTLAGEMSVCLLLLPDGTPPAGGQYSTRAFSWPFEYPAALGGTDSVIRTLDATEVLSIAIDPGPYRVWVSINDSHFPDNSGDPILTLTNVPPLVTQSLMVPSRLLWQYSSAELSIQTVHQTECFGSQGTNTTDCFGSVGVNTVREFEL